MFDLINNWDRDKQVNSGFGPRNISVPGASKNHKGIDLSSDNDNIPSVVAGKVVANGWNSGRGNYISILGVDGYTTTYQHLASKSPLSVGSYVSEGQTIGTQGSTGVSGGKHLHFEVKSASGLYVNPVEYLKGAFSTGNPVTDGVTDGNDRPINGGAGVGSGIGSGAAMDIVGKIIKIVVVALIIVLAAFLFMKAFDIKVMR